ncbi:MAG: radical SAM protein [Proteobacteria bacterium]|nr:radical SAM protein [Pseudomonadota bacterium]
MHYQGNIFRPPSEAYSILLQITTGCSHNKCTFCGMYKGTRFSIKNDDTIMADIDFAALHCRNQDRLFLCDGDALILPQERLLSILAAVRVKLPWVTRIGTYANTKSIRMKTPEQLKELHAGGLAIAYMGLESGDDVTLQNINKGADAEKMIDMGKKLRAAGMKLSITVLLGIAGRERSHIHARETGRVLCAIDPEYVGALSLMLTPNTPLFQASNRGEFFLLSSKEMLEELAIMIAGTELTNGYFHANHASNYLPIKAKLPKDKKATLQLIARALDGKVGLKPEYMRGL